jgi:DNA-binding transcriptional regulator YhcF (GntR family)
VTATYRQIADELGGRIRAGELRPGDRLPSTRQIARDWHVAMATATKVLAALQQDGFAAARPGAGTVVTAGAARRGRRQVPAPSGERELTREAIIRTAISIADAEGLAELSMRRIAAALGVATMSLYRHVRGKEDLVLHMIDAAIGEEPFPATAPAGWRAGLEVAARLQWRGFRRHPWLAPVMSITRPQLAPNALRHTEWNLRALDGTALGLADRMYVNILLFAYVRGVATALEAESQAERDTGLTSDEWMETQDGALRSLLTSGELATFRRMAGEQGFDFDLGSLFEFGLERLLDGLESFLATGISARGGSGERPRDPCHGRSAIDRGGQV